MEGLDIVLIKQQRHPYKLLQPHKNPLVQKRVLLLPLTQHGLTQLVHNNIVNHVKLSELLSDGFLELLHVESLVLPEHGEELLVHFLEDDVDLLVLLVFLVQNDWLWFYFVLHGMKLNL